MKPVVVLVLMYLGWMLFVAFMVVQATGGC